jgi:5-dehydro-4-deoxyglucarate dehydratase
MRQIGMTRDTATRRRFLKGIGLAFAASSIGAEVAFGDSPMPAKGGASQPKLSPQEFKQKLVGPIWSNPCLFKENFDLDEEGTKHSIERALKYGIRNFAATAGNTQYSSLNEEEIKRVNRNMVEAVSGRGLTIVATGDWWTGQAVEFARWASSIGASAVQVMLPTRSGGDESVAEHLSAIAKACGLPLVLHGKYTLPLLKRLAQIDAIVAMKEDATLNELIDQQVAFGDRFRIFGGGGENRSLVGKPYGMTAFYSTYSTFAPDISMSYWKAFEAGDEKKATEITLKYDYPFIGRFSHAFWHATLEYFGVGKRYLRPPQVSFTDAQVAELKQFFDGQGLSPDRYK